MYRADFSLSWKRGVRSPGLRRAIGLFGCAVVLFVSVSATIADPESWSQPLVWSPQKSGVLARLNSVFFIDQNRGWTVGSSGIWLMTEDGGKKWVKQPLPERQQREMLRDLWFFNGHGGRLLGEYAIVNRGGEVNWKERVFLLFNDQRDGEWREGDFIWQASKQPGQGKPAARVSDQNPVGADSSAKTSPDPVLLRIFFVDDQHGWACGEGGSILETKDGGASWVLQSNQARKLLYDVFAVDAKQAWITGAGGTVLYTTDGGQRWVEQSSGVTQALRAIHFTDASHGWAVGSEGVVIATTDGGRQWQAQTSNTRQNLNDVVFVSAEEGWAAGDRGVLLHTRDGGQTWEDLTFDTHANLARLFFISPACGWVVGSNGVIFKYGPDPNAGN